MKVQIRRSIFETNSSSTHTLTITSHDTFKAWKDNKLKYCYILNSFLTNEEADAYNANYMNEQHTFSKDYNWIVSTYGDSLYLSYTDFIYYTDICGAERLIEEKTISNVGVVAISLYIP